MDFVPSHTSDQHAWFQESRQSRDNPKADWYVWADAKPDGNPPNNWLAVFGGSTWEWEPRRGQYYLHNFLKEQPDLNFHNPQVIEALLGPGARSGSSAASTGSGSTRSISASTTRSCATTRRAARRIAAGSAPGSPFAMQQQLWNKARPELVELFLKPLHALTERYDGKVVLGEISGDDALLRAAEYTNGGGLDIAYSFDLLSCPGTPRGSAPSSSGWRRRSATAGAAGRSATTTSAASVSRWGGDDPPEGLRRLVPVLLGWLRGTVCLYQGEELGLEEAELAFEQISDPFGIAFWPTFKGRDGCRTPMPWAGCGARSGLHHRRPLAADSREPSPPRGRPAGRRTRARSSTPPAPSSTGGASASRCGRAG